MAKVIKAMNPSLRWLTDLLSFFQTESIKVPTVYREQVLGVKKILTDDVTGLVSTMLDFSINCALVDYKVDTNNANLSTALNDWLGNINEDLRGKVPTGLEALAKEYFRERWKGSSCLVLRTFWTKKDGLILPNFMFFVDGEDIKCKSNSEDGVVRLGEEKYYIRVSNDPKKDILLPKDKNEELFIQKPYEQWGIHEPVPYLIRKGLYRNMEFLKLLSSKGEYVLSKALEYMLLVKKGTENLAREGKAEFVYSQEDLKKVSEDLATLIQEKKSVPGTPTYTTNFDTSMEHIIPEYGRIINESLYAPVERRLLAGLGLVDIVEGTSSTRREAMLNPKPFIGEVKQGIKDFKVLLYDIIKTIIIKNKSNHPKWMNAKIEVVTSPVKEFVSSDVKQLLRSIYDRGSLSKRTLVEIAGELDYDLEVKRREEETKLGHTEKMYPPVIQNIEQNSGNNNEEKIEDEETTPDKKGPEKKNYNMSNKEYEEAPYRDNESLPSEVKKYSKKAQDVFRNAFNNAFKEYKDEQVAFKVAWSALKDYVKKNKGEFINE